MLNFVKCFFCIYWDDHMICIVQFVNVVYYMDWFVAVELHLHLWNKSHLIWYIILLKYCSVPFDNFLLSIFTYMFIRDIDVYIFLWYIVLFKVVWSCWPHKMSFRMFPYLLYFGRIWEEFIVILRLMFQDSPQSFYFYSTFMFL